MIYLLDTDTLSALMRPVSPGLLMTKLSSVPNEELSTSTITLGEIVYGAHRVPSRRAGILQALETVLPTIQVVPFDLGAARKYGELRADLERQGTPIGDADTRIAATALSRGLTVVTGNVRHFELVPHLLVENWMV